jgi:TetR/AcrR family fatty acid metabolism transcriptional regulator
VRIRSPQSAAKILDAAGRLFGTRRFHEVRMDDIAAEAGVGKGTLYRYFKDKDELYLKLLERASGQFTERVQAAVAHQGGTRDRLVALVTTVLDYFDENPHLLELIQRAELLRGLGAGFPWQAARETMFRLAAELFDSARRDTEYTLRDPEVAMMLLMGGMRTILRFGPRPRPERMAERAVDALLGDRRRGPHR